MNALSNVVNTILRLPKALKIQFIGGKRTYLAGRTLDIDFNILANVEKTGVRTHTQPPEQARKSFAFLSDILNPPVVASQRLEDMTVNAAGHGIPVRSYTPRAAKPGGPALMYLHGGGHTIGSIETHNGFCSQFAESIGCKLFSVDYRLGPENKFPSGLEDGLAVYEWLLANADRLQVDAERISVGGDSAGGNLSMALSVSARDKGIPLPKSQILIYPSADSGRDTESYHTFGEGFMLTKELLAYFSGHYLNGPDDKKNPLVSPLLLDDVSGLPPTVLEVAGFDPLHDEGIALAEKLKAAGVEVDILRHHNLGHGFVTMSGVLKSAEVANKEIFAAAKSVIY